MNQFLKVLQFEISNYFKTKGYVLTTLLVSLALIIGLSLPSVFDMSNIFPFLESSSQEETTDSSNDDKNEDIDNEDIDNEEFKKLALLDPNDLIDDMYLKEFFPDVSFVDINDEGKLKTLIKDNEVNGGFIVDSLTKFDYFVKDSTFGDHNSIIFEELLSLLNRITYATNNNLDFEELETAYNATINSNTTILGKDGLNNYTYAYILVFLLYFMILTYGQLISVSVTNEKSNRSIEILVTSVNTTSLISGKVIAATLASFIQMGIILASGMIAYSINKSSWNGILDNIFDMPGDILIVFVIFGCLGYLFYAFIFGTLGALVSKTEDISSSITPVMLVFIFVFGVAIFGMQNIDSTWMKVSSFIPFSSCLTMPTRFAMGSVSTTEIIISLVILILSTILVAYIASKIYRMATLRYGNPIKLKDAFKLIKKENS